MSSNPPSSQWVVHVLPVPCRFEVLSSGDVVLVDSDAPRVVHRDEERVLVRPPFAVPRLLRRP